jgi:type IV pilus assembly protein PilW
MVRGDGVMVRQWGFSLVELMVGLAIGLLATLVIVQVYTTFSAQQRKVSGSADAQTSGGLATYMIQREAQLGGYGLPVFDTTNPALMCGTVNMDNGGTITPTSLSPVSIVDGGAGAGASDQIVVRYGDSQTGGVNTSSVAYSGDALTAFNNLFAPYLHATGPGNCPLTLSDCASTQYLMTTSGGTCTIAPISNTQNINVNAAGGLAYIGSWNVITFAVNNNQLERNNIPIAPDVVDLQAQYGVSAAQNSNVITQWVDATGATWANPSVANRNRIKAIHIAIVARNEQRDTGNVTASCSSLTTANPTGLCAWAGSDTSPAPSINLADADWQKYHYRVFDTIIPLRNVIWSGNTLP